jgi:hypothetical protein
VFGRLNQRMVQFIGRQEMVWIATADGQGACDCSFRAGPPGFVQVPDDRTVRYPEYRGTGARKHLPHLVRMTGEGRDWGTDEARAKGGDYFGTACQVWPAPPG